LKKHDPDKPDLVFLASDKYGNIVVIKRFPNAELCRRTNLGLMDDYNF
jgi:hypothetical protein